MGSQESLFSSRVLEGGGEAVLAELDLVLRLVVELEPGAESDHCCQSISSSPWSHVDPNNVDPLWSLVRSLNSQPPHCTASLNIEVLAPPGRAIWVKTLPNSRNKRLAGVPLRVEMPGVTRVLPRDSITRNLARDSSLHVHSNSTVEFLLIFVDVVIKFSP